VIVIIPVKSSRVKSRLSSVLSKEQRTEFSRSSLLDLLDVLRTTGLLRRSTVVSSDRRILKLASEKGTKVVEEEGDAGVNEAVRRGLAALEGDEDVLVLPSDLALLEPSELRRLLRLRSAELDVVISPSAAFNGTNALLFSSASGFPLSYDDDSFWNHLASCGRLGLSVGVCCEKGLMFDIDTPDDLKTLARSRSKRRSVVFAREALS